MLPLSSEQSLLSLTGNPNAQNANGDTPLSLVVTQQLLNVAKKLLQRGANPNLANNRKVTPLMLAKTPEMANLLIQAGAHVNARDDHGCTSLLNAVKNNSLTIARTLLNCNADPDISSEDGCIPLFEAIKRDNLLLTKLLLEEGADPNKPVLCTLISWGNPEMVKLLIEHGFNKRFLFDAKLETYSGLKKIA